MANAATHSGHTINKSHHAASSGIATWSKDTEGPHFRVAESAAGKTDRVRECPFCGSRGG